MHSRIDLQTQALHNPVTFKSNQIKIKKNQDLNAQTYHIYM